MNEEKQSRELRAGTGRVRLRLLCWIAFLVAPLLAQLPLNVSSEAGNASLRVQAEEDAGGVTKRDDEGDPVFASSSGPKGSDDDGGGDDDDGEGDDDDEGVGESEDEKDDDEDEEDYRAKRSRPKTGDDITIFDPVTDEARKFSLPVETTARRIIAEPRTSTRPSQKLLPGTKTFPEIARLTKRLYILNINDDDRVDVLNTSTLVNDAGINLAQGYSAPLTSPQDMELTPDGGTLVVTNLGFEFEDLRAPPHLTFINTHTDTIADRLEFEEDFRPWQIELSPDGTLAYVFMERREGFTTTENLILVVDVARRETVDEIQLTTNTTPRAMAITPDGALLFVSVGGPVITIDTRSRTVSASFRVTGFSGNLMAVHPNGTDLYLGPVFNVQAEPRVDGIAVVDIATLTESTRIPIREFPLGSQSMVVTRNGRFIYVKDPSSGTVAKISTKTWQPVSEIAIEPVVGIVFTAP